MDTESKTLQKQIEVEQKIIHILLKSRSAIDEMIDSGIGVELFNDDHRALVKCIYKEYLTSDRKRILNRDTYSKHIMDEGDKDNLIHRLKVYDTCFVGVFSTPDDLGHLKKDMMDGYFGRQIYTHLKKFNDEIKRAGYQSAAKILLENIQSTIGIADSREVVFASLNELKDEYVQDVKRARENPSSTVRCGIPEIDDAVNVGFQPQHLTLFVADTGGHKTNIMLNIALNISDRGHPVLFVPLEMPWKNLVNRIICNRVGIPNIKLAKPELLTDEELAQLEKSKFWLEENAKTFCILDSKERFSISTLRRELERRLSTFRPKVVVIDYADILETEVKYGSRTVEIGEMIKSLRTLGKKYGFSIITAAQMNRAAIKALREGKDEAVDSTAIHGSHSYSADSDTIFGLMKVPGELDKIKICTIKARHGPSGQTNELRVDPSRFLITSTNGMMMLCSETELESDLNRSPQEIASAIKRPVEFATSSFELDDIN